MSDLVKRLHVAAARLDEWVQKYVSAKANSAEAKLIREAADRIDALERQVKAADALADAVTLYIYETTHLSAEEDDGSHWCRISKDCLAQGRTTLAAYEATKEQSDA